MRKTTVKYGTTDFIDVRRHNIWPKIKFIGAVGGVYILLQFILWCVAIMLIPILYLHPAPGFTSGDELRKWITDQQQSMILHTVPCLLAALTSWLMKHYCKTHPLNMTDTPTGRVVPVARSDELWLIDLKHWPWIF